MAGGILLREVQAADLPILFEHQLDPAANHMAAFTAENPADSDAFLAHWTGILGLDSITKMTIMSDGQVAGSIVRFEVFGEPEVGYWLGRRYWGRGIATRALATFLRLVHTRPLYARVAKDNSGSIGVLETCGFTIHGEERGFANARGEEIEEYILRLDTRDDHEAGN